MEPFDQTAYEAQLSNYQHDYPTRAADMIAKGWQVIWATYCGPKEDGSPDYRPLMGTTGGRAEFPSNRDMPAGARIAFRPPPTVKVFDVDHYKEKLGAHTIERAEEKLGDLPPTWKVTSRGPDDRGGRYLYRYEGPDFTDRALAAFADPDTGATCVEIVRTGHRFSWGPGDVNPKNMQVVQCYGPDGNVCALPRVDELPYLPEAWHRYLSDPPRVAIPQLPAIDQDAPQWWLAIPDNSLGTRRLLEDLSFNMLLCGADDETVIAQMLRTSVARDLGRPWTRESVMGLVDGNTHEKIAKIRAEWAEERAWVAAQVPGGEARLQQAAREAQEEYEHHQRYDLNALVAADIYATLAGKLPPVTAYHQLVRGGQFIAESADSHEVAKQIVGRTLDVLRYDAENKAWLSDQGNRWATVDPLMYVAGICELMPHLDEGDGDNKDDGAIRHNKARARLRNNSMGPVVERMGAVSGLHGKGTVVSQLDQEADQLWAGGQLWSLRTLQRLDGTGVVHLRNAPYAPDQNGTHPYLEGLRAEIWPDEATRAWVLRVLGRSILGGPWRGAIEMPGGTGTGKSTLGELMISALGNVDEGGYAVSLSDSVLSRDVAEEVAFSALVGARWAYLDEYTDSKSKVTVTRLKKLTGGATYRARLLYANAATFRPSHTFAVSLNPDQTSLPYGDSAVADRITRIPFDGDKARVRAARELFDQHREEELPAFLWTLMQHACGALKDSSYGTMADAPATVADAKKGAVDEGQAEDYLSLILEWGPEVPEQDVKDLVVAIQTHEVSRRRHDVPESTRALGKRLSRLVGDDKPKLFREGNGKRLWRVRIRPQAWAGYPLR